MKPNVWVSAAFSVLALALLAMHLVRNSFKVEALDAGLLFLALVASGWTIFKRLKVAAIGEVEYRELKEEVKRQEGEIQALQFVVAHFLPDAELRVLKRLAAPEPYDLASDDHEFFNATGPLRGLGFMEPIPENWTPGSNLNDTTNLKTLFRITERGQEYLALHDQAKAFKP